MIQATTALSLLERACSVPSILAAFPIVPVASVAVAAELQQCCEVGERFYSSRGTSFTREIRVRFFGFLHNACPQLRHWADK